MEMVMHARIGILCISRDANGIFAHINPGCDFDTEYFISITKEVDPGSIRRIISGYNEITAHEAEWIGATFAAYLLHDVIGNL